MNDTRKLAEKIYEACADTQYTPLAKAMIIEQELLSYREQVEKEQTEKDAQIAENLARFVKGLPLPTMSVYSANDIAYKLYDAANAIRQSTKEREKEQQ